MSAARLKAAIQAATSNDRIQGCIAGATIDIADSVKIAQAALTDPSGQSDGIDAQERGVLNDLFSRIAQPRIPGQMSTMACPENPSAVDMTPGALDTFKSMFREAGIDHPSLLKERVEDALSRVRLGTPLAAAPDVSGMKEIPLGDRRPVDGDKRDAFVNRSTGQFYLRSIGAGMAGPEFTAPRWHGPIGLGQIRGTNVTVATRAKLLDKLEQVTSAGESFNLGGLPAGPAFREVQLSAPPLSMADGFSYSAMIAAGGLDPMASPGDPNTSSMVFLKRTGGIAGQTAFYGPFSLADMTNPPVPTPPTQPTPNPGQCSIGDSAAQKAPRVFDPLSLRLLLAEFEAIKARQG